MFLTTLLNPFSLIYGERPYGFGHCGDSPRLTAVRVLVLKGWALLAMQ